MPGEETEPQQSKTLVAGETGYQGTRVDDDMV